DLKVVSKTSIMQYKGSHKSLPEIGRELGVDAALEGSIMRDKDRVRITAQLVRTNTDRHSWAQAYEGDLQNILSLQAQVASAISEDIRIKFNSQQVSRLRPTRSFDPEAYDIYLRGRYVAARRTPEALHQAIGYFNEATMKDPSFAAAYAGL